MSIAKLVIDGKVIRAPEKRFLPNNSPVTEFAIMHSEEKPTKDGLVTETLTLKVIGWGEQMASKLELVEKGDIVAVDGRLQLEEFEDSEGEKQRQMELVATDVELLRKDSAPKRADDLDAIFAS